MGSQCATSLLRIPAWMLGKVKICGVRVRIIGLGFRVSRVMLFVGFGIIVVIAALFFYVLSDGLMVRLKLWTRLGDQG